MSNGDTTSNKLNLNINKDMKFHLLIILFINVLGFSGIVNAQKWEIDFIPVSDIFAISEQHLILTSNSEVNSAFSLELKNDTSYSFKPLIKGGFGPGEMLEISDIEYDSDKNYVWFVNRYNGKIIAHNYTDDVMIERLTDHIIIPSISIKDDLLLISVNPLIDGAYLESIKTITLAYLYQDSNCIDTLIIPTNMLELDKINGIEKYSQIQIFSNSILLENDIVTSIQGFDFLISTSLSNSKKHKKIQTGFNVDLPFEIINSPIYGKGQRTGSINQTMKKWKNYLFIASGLGTANSENKYNINIYKNEIKIDSFDLLVNYASYNLKYSINNGNIFYMDGNSLIKLKIENLISIKL